MSAPSLAPEREARIRAALERVEASCDRAARLGADPVGLVRRFHGRANLEIAGLVASSLAFGNVKTLRARVEEVFERLGPEIALAADDQLGVFARLHGFRHRVYRGEDVARLVIGARRVQRAHGSLEACFVEGLGREGDLRAALTTLVAALRSAGGFPEGKHASAGARHILSDPGKTSGCKRLLLYLRWMVRPEDGVDLGVWRHVPPRLLLVPVDTHIHKLSRNLGFTRRAALGWATTEDITRALRRFDPEDPVRFDFSLCHLGMLQRCPSRRDPARCEGCGVLGVCRHWSGGRPRPEAPDTPGATLRVV